jgi:hypothetical protein
MNDFSIRRYTAYLRIFVVGVLAACTDRPSEPIAEAPAVETEGSCNDAGVRDVVENLGMRMKDVPLLAPDSVVTAEIREAYESLVTPALLTEWLEEPASAPGRDVSSPWPERIEAGTVEPAGEGVCRVEGEVVYVTSVELAEGGAAHREPVTLQVTEDDGWRISAYETAATAAPTPPPDSSDTSAEAVDVLHRYYAAINTGDYRQAYGLWGDGGASSGQTFEAFAAGFEETVRSDVEIGTPGRVEGAAGSQYVEVPVVIQATAQSGAEQRFEGTYTLRRSMVDGAAPEQRRWHIYSASISGVN